MGWGNSGEQENRERGASWEPYVGGRAHSQLEVVFSKGAARSLVVGDIFGGCRVRATLGTREFWEHSDLFSPAFYFLS